MFILQTYKYNKYKFLIRYIEVNILFEIRKKKYIVYIVLTSIDLDLVIRRKT